MEDLLKKYNLKQSQYEYELQRAIKNNLDIKDWLRYKFLTKHSLLIDDTKRVLGRSLVVDFLNNFSQDTGFLLDKSLQKRVGSFLVKHRGYNIFSYWVDNVLVDKGLKYSWKEINPRAIKEFDILLDLEINIKNNELFWILFGFFVFFFRFLTHKEKQIKQMLKRFNRLNVSLLYRSQWIHYFESMSQCCVKNNYEVLEGRLNKLTKELIEINKKYSDLDYLTIYRGFQLRQGETNIRSELNRKKQKVGKGFFYTLNKDYGKIYTINSNIYGHFSFYLYNYDDDELISLYVDEQSHVGDLGKLKIDREEFAKNKKYRNKIYKTDIYKNYIKEQLIFSNKNIDKLQFNELDRCIIGTYRVRKKDILFFKEVYKKTFSTTFKEQSVFCFDEDVDLVRYDYLSQKDFSFVHKLFSKYDAEDEFKVDALGINVT